MQTHYQTEERRIKHNLSIRNLRDKRKSLGLCIYCGSPSEMKKNSCDSCYIRSYNLKVMRGDYKKWRSNNLEKARKIGLESERRRNFGGNYYHVLERDKYSCQKCFTKKDILIHHIDGKGYNVKNKNNSMNNLITLCRSCHGLHHRSLQKFPIIYGTKRKCKFCKKIKRICRAKILMCRSCFWFKYHK